MKEKTSGEKLGQDLSNFVNGFDFDKAGFVKSVTNEHRTLQQLMFTLFVSCVEEWAKLGEDRLYDARNEYTVKKSKEIMEKCFPDGVWAPYI